MTLTITQQTMVGILHDFVRFNEREDDVDCGLRWQEAGIRQDVVEDG